MRRIPHTDFIVPLLLAVISACAWCLLSVRRAERVLSVAAADQVEVKPSTSSPTGYEGGIRRFVVPERADRAYAWLLQTEWMLRRGEWRVRVMEELNAPQGQTVRAASLYRWYLGALAWLAHRSSGRPLGSRLESVALWAEPLLFLFLAAATCGLAWWRLGPWPAMVGLVWLACCFPLGAGFLPGVPDGAGLARILAVGSVLPLVLAPRGRDALGGGSRSCRWFAAAGVIGGLGLWHDALAAAPVLAGLGLGGLALAARAEVPTPADWRHWSLGGALASLGAYLMEFFPDAMEFSGRENHPLFGLAWLAMGELLAWRAAVAVAVGAVRRKRDWMRAAVAGIALIATVALLAGKGTLSAIWADPFGHRLSNLPGGAGAGSLAEWLRGGPGWAGLATLLPISVLVIAGWRLARGRGEDRGRVALGIALGPTLVALAIGTYQLAWWVMFELLLLPVVWALCGRREDEAKGRPPWVVCFAVAAAAIAGLIAQLPPARGSGATEFTRDEAEALMERGLAHWLADRADAGAAVLISPDRTMSFCYHSGLRGLGSADPENREGTAAVAQIMASTKAIEVQSIARQRGVAFIVLISWDQVLDAFASLAGDQASGTFVAALRRWSLPPWVTPVAYKLPSVPGFEDQEVLVFRLSEETNRARALARLAEFAIEAGKPDLAAAVHEGLKEFPADLNALVARAQIARARGEAAAFERQLDAIQTAIDNGMDRALPWDRRVSLAIVLALGRKEGMSLEQLTQCTKTATAARLRELSVGALFRFEVLRRKNQLELGEESLRQLARRLLPPELRRRL